MYNDELMHYGIKGMRWGVRRKNPMVPYDRAKKGPQKIKPPIPFDGTKRGPKKIKPPVLSRTSKRSSARSSIKDMSDDELKRKIDRLQKEQQYKNLTTSTASKVGKRIVQGILITAALEVSKNYVAGHMKDGIAAAEQAIKNLMSK